MIGSIEGSVIYQNDTHAIIKTTSGVGYKVAFTKGF